MDREAIVTKIKTMKTKARSAHKGGKKELALSFKKGMRRLQRALKVATPKVRRKKSETAEPVPGPTPTPAAPA